MKFVRIFATCRDDEEDIIIILCQLKSSNKIDKKIEGFGYIEDWNDESSIHEKYPFILRYKKKKGGIFNYGDWSTEHETTNIFDKIIKAGELFTRFNEDGDEFTYEIKNIINLPQF